jgi:NAD(P)-dependent dehydrogenase (short-subunit alcohol dehydrogenase family)
MSTQNKERKVLVVTGASQGLGEGFVKAYRERGWRVVGNSRTIKPSNDPDYITIPGDVGDPAIARKVVETAINDFGRVDTLINNAGIWRPGPIEKISEELYRRVMATNLDSVFFATQVLHKALELKLFEDQKDSIKLKTLVSAVVDKDTQEKIDIIKARLIKNFGYNEVSATVVLNYVASIFARGDAKVRRA